MDKVLPLALALCLALVAVQSGDGAALGASLPKVSSATQRDVTNCAAKLSASDWNGWPPPRRDETRYDDVS